MGVHTRTVSSSLCILLLLVTAVHGLVSPATTTTTSFTSTKANIVAGATGYIGRAVVKESVRQGYQTIALVRDIDKVRTQTPPADLEKYYQGAQLVECDVTNPDQLQEVRPL